MIHELETPRLRLRQWRTEDRAPFAALNADREVMEFFPTPLDRAASDALACRLERFIAERGWGPWAVESKRSGEFIGFVGLSIPSSDLPLSPCVEVAWRLARPFWGQGFATEAARHALQLGFETLQLPEIVSFTSVLNTRSRAVMERLQMAEDTETFEHPGVPVGSPLRTHCVYRLSSAQWNTITGRAVAAN